jgi:hypothetical protein
MKRTFFLVALYLNIVSSIAQVRLEGKFISERTKLKPSEEILIEVAENRKSTFSDSIGNFTFKNLKKNKQYTLKLNSFQFGSIIVAFKTENDSVINEIFEIKAKCDFDNETAKIEWKNKKAKLYLIGSIAPRANSKADKKFEKKYNIKYYDFGCTPAPTECIIEYNKEVLKLLETEYGKEWKTEIRKDVVVN